ncbi:MAG TPA: prolyl oligopeptidase family serine peptidase [Thermoanaerobaculia bacterium]|nr:prolyl oligopeptidase family serine peptidase [Thermoanaerobaculia bacterium]
MSSLAPLCRIALLLFVSLPLLGATVTWSGASDENWSNPANWTPATVPGPDDTAVFPADATRKTLTLDVDAAVHALSFAYSYTIGGPDERSLTVADVTISNPPGFGWTVALVRRVVVPVNATWNIGRNDLTIRLLVLQDVTLTFPAPSGEVKALLEGSGAISATGGNFHMLQTPVHTQGFSGTIEAMNLFLKGDYPDVDATAGKVIGAGTLKSLTASVAVSAFPWIIKAEDITLSGSGSPLRLNLQEGLLEYTTSLTLSNVELVFPSKGARSVTVVRGGAQPAEGTFNGVPEGATITQGDTRYRITYAGGASGTDVILLWQGGTGDRTWTGEADDRWSNPANWSPVGVPTQEERLIFPSGGAVRETTYDLSTPIREVYLFDTYAVNGGPIVLRQSIHTDLANDIQINADIKVADDVVAASISDVIVNGSVDVNGKLLAIDSTTISGPVMGSGSITLGSWASFGAPDNPFSGDITSMAHVGGDLTEVTLAGSLANASLSGVSLRVTGEQTIGDATLGSVLQLNHPLGAAKGLLHTGSFTLRTYHLNTFPGPRDAIATYHVDLDASSSDMVDVHGSVTLTGDTQLPITALATLPPGTVYTIIRNDGTDAVDGRFVSLSLDTLEEGAELTAGNVTLRLSYEGGDGNDVTLTVPGGQVPPVMLTGEDTSTTERNADGHAVNVPLTLSRPASSPITVQYHTEDRTARAGEDYASVFGSITLPNGADAASIVVTVLGDHSVEPDEELVVVIDNAGDAEVPDRELVVTIVNDDVAFVRTPPIVYSGASTLEVLRPLTTTGAVPAVVAFIRAADENIVARQAARGYAVVVVSVRRTFPQNLEDARAALSWLRAHGTEHGIDAQRLVAWGIGAGGNVAALLGTKALGGATGLDAVIDWYGETDYIELDERPGTCAKDYASLFGCDPAVCRDKARSASPMEYVSSDDAPFLIVHGTADCAVPASQSTRLRDALVRAGVAATFVSVRGANHGGDAFTKATVNEAVDAFLDQHLAQRTSKRRAVRH